MAITIIIKDDHGNQVETCMELDDVGLPTAGEKMIRIGKRNAIRLAVECPDQWLSSG